MVSMEVEWFLVAGNMPKEPLRCFCPGSVTSPPAYCFTQQELDQCWFINPELSKRASIRFYTMTSACATEVPSALKYTNGPQDL